MIDKNQKVLLELLKASLFGMEPVVPADVDWDAVLAEAKAQTVVALAAKAVPAEYAAQWQNYALQSQAQFVRVLHEQMHLVNLFEQNGIPIVILKGTAAAMYYPEPARRAMGDIDFIVPQDKFEEARALMLASKYVPVYGENDGSRHVGYWMNGVLFELHHHFGSFGLDVENIIADGMSRTVTASVCGCPFPMLPEVENGIILLTHIRHHLIEEQYSLGLRQVIDWMMYVHVSLYGEGWRVFKLAAQRYRLDTLAVTMTFVAKSWLGLPDDVAWCMDADAVLAEELLDRVMTSGNFSSKRVKQIEPVKSALLNLRTIGVFRYLQEAGLAKWGAAKRYPFLRPFAWTYQVGHFAKKGVGILISGGKIGREVAKGRAQNAFLKRLGI